MKNEGKQMRAIWRGAILAESDQTIVIENNQYFPPDSVNREHFSKSEATTFCPWKGDACYHDVVVGDSVNSGAAWFYSEPMEAVKEIKDYIAFWKGVEVVEAD